MKKVNNKGFTLIEMIIAITIFSIVISLGYRIFNGSQKALTHQSEVFNSQTSMNLINKFLSNDLEQTKGILGPLKSDSSEIDDLQSFVNTITSNNSIQYIYKLQYNNRTQGEQISTVYRNYIVDISVNNKGDYIYDITRLDENNSSIKLLSNKTTHDSNNLQIPLTISFQDGTYDTSGKYTGNGIYDIKISYKDKAKYNIYKFSVESRLD